MINRRRFLEQVGIGAAAMMWPGCRKSAPGRSDNGAKRARPNFLVLVSDDQRWDQLSCADTPLIPELKTPHIDELAEQGVYSEMRLSQHPSAVCRGLVSCPAAMPALTV